MRTSRRGFIAAALAAVASLFTRQSPAHAQQWPLYSISCPIWHDGRIVGRAMVKGVDEKAVERVARDIQDGSKFSFEKPADVDVMLVFC